MINVDDFMSKLAAQTAPVESKRTSYANFGPQQKRQIEKIYLNIPDNFGRYQILPLSSVVTDYPFVTLFNTREIGIPKKKVAADGTESTYTTWIKMIPMSAYQMKDASGRLVPSLTAEEEQILKNAYSVFDELYNEVGAKDNLAIQKSLARKKNYTIFNGYAINKWGFTDNRVPVRNNFAGLFVCTSKGFINSVQDNLSECSVMNNGSYDFLQGIYGRESTGRDGFIMLSISKKIDAAGFNVSVKHEYGRASMLSSVVIPDADIEMLQDPLAEFLGSQARQPESENQPATERRLFNAPLIKEAIAFMSQQLAAVRAAKNAGTSIEDAIAATNEVTLANQPVYQPKTRDAMLNAEAAQSAETQETTTTENLQTKNTEPFATPAAGHFSPMGTPESATPSWNQSAQPAQSAPFTTPSFTGFGAQGQNDLPF